MLLSPTMATKYLINKIKLKLTSLITSSSRTFCAVSSEHMPKCFTGSGLKCLRI